ncbi:COPI associated protein-domain-containing protein [Umbelopsis sp. PMI_123]|nr:COPI associated protein-domain-containing protein [Umbelopsis sp. PMI_123]
MANLDLVFRICNIVVACFMIIGGLWTIFAGGFPNFIQGIFCMLFGIMTAGFEFRLPAAAAQHVSFMFSFLGRGIFYIFIGCIMLNYAAVAIASGVIVTVVGVAFVVLQFVPRVEPPPNMRRKAMDDTLQGYYNDTPSDYPTGQQQGGQYPSGSAGYYQQNASNPPQQSYNVGGVV